MSFQFRYGRKEEQPNAVAVQLKLLQLLSSESHQNVTYHCRNSVAYKDKKSSNLKKALVLRGSDGQELRAQGNNRLRYTVVEDGCSVRPSPPPIGCLKRAPLTSPFSPQTSSEEWGRTVIEYRTQTANRLPVVDLAPMDIGKANQEFGLDIGPVCFS